MRHDGSTRRLSVFLLVGCWLATVDTAAVKEVATSATSQWSKSLSARLNPRRQINATTAKPSARRLDAGLDCDLDIFNTFIESEAGQDIYMWATLCESHIVYLKNVRAGGYGPVEQTNLRDAMCSTECMKSDTLHQMAMANSRCSCSQLSASTFVQDDFCLDNSGRLLCTHLGECGHWNCAVDDFMCLRYEWDRLYPCTAMLRFPTVDRLLLILTMMLMLWLHM